MEDKSFTRVEKPAFIPEGWENKVPRRRILVVDDDDDIRRFNAEALTGSGYHVEAAVDGAQGWAALNASRYDLLITDNNMPNLTGIELVKKINAARMPVPVILASGMPHAEEAELRLAATLPKPFTLEELLGTVKKVLGEVDGGQWQAPPSNRPSVDPWRV
jgi:two-component system, chemotaxis family, chemotaxis protein CheY